MIRDVVRVVIGFAAACLAAGLTTVFFVHSPLELPNLPGTEINERMALVAALATHVAVFAAPFALIGIAVAEWRRIRDATYYELVAIAIALAGFLAQYSSETVGDASILNSYAALAFLASGIVAGLTYWLVAGRWAGRPEEMSPPIGNAPAVPEPSTDTH